MEDPFLDRIHITLNAGLLVSIFDVGFGDAPAMFFLPCATVAVARLVALWGRFLFSTLLFFPGSVFDLCRESDLLRCLPFCPTIIISELGGGVDALIRRCRSSSRAAIASAAAESERESRDRRSTVPARLYPCPSLDKQDAISFIKPAFSINSVWARDPWASSSQDLMLAYEN